MPAKKPYLQATGANADSAYSKVGLSIPDFTFDPWTSNGVALPRFHVSSYWRAISPSVEWYRVGAIPGPYLSATSTGYWAGRPLSPFVISTRNCRKMQLQLLPTWKLKPPLLWTIMDIELSIHHLGYKRLARTKWKAKDVQLSVPKVEEQMRNILYKMARH